jgi:hypothetical protein
MLNNLQWNAKANHYQLLNLPETDPAQYIPNHPGIETISMPYPVDVSYPETQLAYSRCTRRIQTRISGLKNDIQGHPRSMLLSRLIVSDLSLHGYTIQHAILTCHHSLLTYDSTPGTPLNCAYPLYITLELFILLHSTHISSFLNVLNQWLPAHTECPSCRQWTFRCRGGSSRSAHANIWSYASSVWEGRC